MNKKQKSYEPLSSLLQILPREISQRVFHRLDEVIAYEPTIGLMGKTGAGKSSLCNTLFTSPPANVDAVKGCTRFAQQYKTSGGLNALNIIDFPGIGETPTLDKMYAHLYQHWLNKLDLIVWVLKADDRAWNDDIRCYRQLVSQGADPARCLFVLNQADKIEPCREWDIATRQPSLRQQQNLQEKVTQVNTVFSPVHPVLAVSASEGFNIPGWVETLITVLPDKASSAVARQLEPEYRTEKVTTTAQEGFGRVVGDIFDASVEALLESHKLRTWLKQVRSRLLSLAKLLWHRFF
ncbi:50S ribosome-binding GTPase [Serratia marcescens]|uniref:GTPase family protein n=1 Tax=Serratia marcescens TaxID=615 RepID=UPI00275F2394|nr:GTPase [Serratia marcescens]MDP8608050.1 50S ribosome-binding GTPase [Serratia marcescens]MDP8613142.1 50S ribosome-binding GTPase [Serratia marcescens]MDP8643196.1 50S ribosome-binding GTPase [Serratia marcescens]MDP8653131.1 50S ribosome-binding GTPase [Serratia marcescens]MDP8658094.1 50S ribosome-binding GTPase [Serratia marcescens]